MSSANNIVPAYPYEGALYWMFSERGGSSYTGGHQYYQSLYGLNHDVVLPKASALACLFENILMTPADAKIPTDSTLRVAFAGDYMEWDKEVEQLARRLLEKATVQKLFKGNLEFFEEFTRFHFLCRTISQIILADKNKAVLVGNDFFDNIYSEVVIELGNIYNKSSGIIKPWSLDLELLSIVGLDFGTADIEKFAAIRQTSEISDYATDFRKAISNASSSGDLKKHLIQLMKQAMDHENIARQAVGAFETIGTTANVGGLIPVIGSITTAVGIGSDAAGRASRHIEAEKQWYLIGPKMREALLKDMLENSD